MKNRTLLLAFWPLLFVTTTCLAACGADTSSVGGATGGKTNWLSPCERDADCSELPDAFCAERRCTKACEEDMDCDGLGTAVECGEAEVAGGEARNVCVARSGESSECDAALCDEQPADDDVSDDDSGDDDVSDDDSGDDDVSDDDAGDDDVSDDDSGDDDVSDDDAGDDDVSDDDVGAPPSCFGPDSHLQEIYDCTREGCACETSDDVVCRTGADERRYALRCEDGKWTPLDNSRCATDTTRCFSPTQNLDLALSGTIAGCPCVEDDFECAIDGARRIPMACVNDRWRAMPDGGDCEDLFQDICAIGDPSELCDGGPCTTEPICDGSDDVRFLIQTGGGGVVDEYHSFHAAYGFSFLAIDGHCNYWVGPTNDGSVRAGVLEQERAQEVAPLIGYGRLSDYEAPDSTSCFDGTTTVYRDPSGSLSCYCGECSQPGAPAELASVVANASALQGELATQGTDLTGGAQLLLVADETLEPLGPGTPWPLDLDPLEHLFVYNPDLGSEQVDADSGFAITDDGDLALLRAARLSWLDTQEYRLYPAPGVHMTYQQADAGAPTHLKVFLRDDVPDHVRATLGF